MPRSLLFAIHHKIRLLTIIGLAALLLAYGAIWLFGVSDISAALDRWPFTLLGIAGASVANSTGTGGGVVFVPAFSMIARPDGVAFTTAEIVAISLLIQCFGMSVGSLTWLNRLYGGHAPAGISHSTFWRTIVLALAGCLPALWLTQILMQLQSQSVLFLFKGFSLLLGLILLASLFSGGNHSRRRLGKADQRVIPLIGAVGGFATALFSVGVGEFLALWLFIRGYSLNMSVATAVIATAVTVLAAAPLAILQNDIHWEILAMTVPGVMLGGFLGRRIAQTLGATRLKFLTALWIIGSSLALIWRSL